MDYKNRVTDNPYAVQYAQRRPSPRRPPIVINKEPKLEESLFATIFGDEALQMVIRASFRSQDKDKLPGYAYFSETLEESKGYTEEEIRQSIIAISAEVQFTAIHETHGTEVHQFTTLNPLGEEHGLLRISGRSSRPLRNSRDFRIFYRVIKGCLQIDSKGQSFSSAKKFTSNTEITFPPGVVYKFINSTCVSCLLYYTIENANTAHLRQNEVKVPAATCVSE